MCCDFAAILVKWGLRDYGLPPQIWDEESPFYTGNGINNCEHEWGDEIINHKYGNVGTNPQVGSQINDSMKGTEKQGQFCQLCRAWRGSLGLEPDPSLYIQHVVQVFREVKRVLRKDGTVFLNLGDSYNAGRTGGWPGGKAGICSQGTKSYYLNRSGPKVENLKPKDLCGIPWRVALALQADGWWLRSDIIWAKPNPMPESVTDRPTRAHEYVFLLTKSGTSQFWTHRDKSGTRIKPKADYRWINQITKEEVSVAPPDWKEKVICPNCEGKGRALIDLSYECLGLWTEYWKEDECPVCEGKKKVQKWKRINLWQGHDYFYDADAVREGNQVYKRTANKQITDNPRHANTLFKKDTTTIGRNLRSVWTIATEPAPEAHFATFPEKLVIPCIKAGTSEKGCCPECGTPWVRVVEKTAGYSGDGNPDTYKDRQVKGSQMETNRKGDEWYKNQPESKTIGWKPSCECGNPKTIPCTVCDPFSGSGKVLTVAKKLFRKAIGIELNADYCEMPVKKLAPGRFPFK